VYKRQAWELARTQAAALGVARSELFPVLAVIASSQTVRREAFFGSQFTTQTIQALDATFALSYTAVSYTHLDVYKRQSLFKECSHYCELVSNPGQMPRVLEIAIREAVGKRGVSVIVIPGDVALQPAIDSPAPAALDLLPVQPRVVPQPKSLEALAELLNSASRVTLLCGSGCAGAHDQLLALGEKLKSPMVYALKGKEHVEWGLSLIHILSAAPFF